jgi:hypothetical protein
MATDGYNVGESVIYKDFTRAEVAEVVVRRTSTKQGTYVLRVWKDEKRQADVFVQDRAIAGRRDVFTLGAAA